MNNMDQKHFLALMKRPGDYAFIDVAKLDISQNYNPGSLEELDSFTMCFTQEELINSIKRGNLVSSDYANCKLVIQDNQKHNPLKLIDKEYYNNFQIDNYLREKINNKEQLNNIINKFRAIFKNSDIKEEFINSLKANNIALALEILFNSKVDYLCIRKFVLYLVDNKNKEEREKQKELIREKNYE